MTENNDTGDGKLEEAASEGSLPGVDEAEEAAREGEDNSDTSDSAEDGQTDDDAPAGGVVMGAVNQH